MPHQLFPELEMFIHKIDAIQPDPTRALLLDQLAAWIRSGRKERPEEAIRITFICTHNSRRSQLAQAWLAALAFWNGISNIKAYSGGTEVTAFHPNAVTSLERAGFHILPRTSRVDNPPYEVSFRVEANPLLMYSKRYDDPANPDQQFGAVMVCSDAEDACPFVPGAQFRLALPYLDPKRSDGSPDAPQVYDQCSMEIATEMNYVIQQILSHE